MGLLMWLHLSCGWEDFELIFDKNLENNEESDHGRLESCNQNIMGDSGKGSAAQMLIEIWIGVIQLTEAQAEMRIVLGTGF